MAKKNLSQAAGLDALFRRPTLPTEEKATSVSPPPPRPKEKAPKKESKAKESPKPKLQEKPVNKRVDKAHVEEAIQESPKTTPPPKPKAPKAKPANTFSVNLEAIRKTETKYTGIRLKKELFDKLGEIAKKEKVKSTNSLISKVLEAFCEGYEGNA